MALFDDATTKARSTIEDAINALGAEPSKVRVGDRAWVVTKGGAAIVVRLVGEKENAFVQAVSPVMKVPAGNTKFLETVLSHNGGMGGLATFATTPQGELVLQSARHVKGMTTEEAAALVFQVAHFSGLYDDKLLDDFGRELAIHPLQKI